MEQGAAAMMSEGPMWLVECSLEGEVRVNQEAIRALARLPRPLQVVSIFGPRQSGKSHLLNLLAGSTGFTVSRGVSFKDPGIYMWSLPDDENPETSLILLDTDGFEEDLIEGRHSCPIFTLSLLLSSVFLYNTWGPVSLDTLDQLLHVTMLTNQVSLPASPLPEFVWCVRDMDLDMTIGDVDLTPADFLDSVLNDIKGQMSPSSVISKLFPRTRMKLFDFCHPLEGSEEVGKLTLSELNPRFLRQTQILRRSIRRTAPKAFQGCQSVSGRELGAILEQFVDHLSRGSIIQLDSMIGKTAAMEDVQDLVFPGDPRVPAKRQKPVVEMETPLCKAHRDSHTTPPATRREGRDLVNRDPLEMEKPVCLIENISAGELHVNQEALDILTSISQPVVVVSIVGMYRTGKSYLMNKLARKRTGFSLGSTIQAETKGIWMWCVPHPYRDDHTLVLLDTEGLGDVEKGSQKDDNWIFALAVLLSSTFIYNSMGTINNDAVMSLHFVTELTEHIKVKSGQKKEETSSEYVRFFPLFVWAVRDFTLELKMDEQTITADEYLENSLKLIRGGSKAVGYSNDGRECIRNYFSCRKCFVFDPPAPKEKLKLLEQLNDSELDEEFVKQTSNFCSYIFNCAKEKTIKGGITVTGSMLGNLAVTYVDTIRSGAIPCLENAVLALSQIENSKAIEQSHAVYKQLMGDLIELHTDTLEELSNIHDFCLKEALQLFMKHAFKDEDQKYQAKLMERVEADYKVKCQENEQISQNYCTALLLQLEYDEDAQKSYMTPGGYNHFRTDLDNLIELYKNKPGKGVKAEQVLEEYLKEKNELGKLILMADESLSEQQRHLKEQQAQAEMESQKAEVAREHQRALERMLKDVENAQRENEWQLKKKMEMDRRAAQEEHQRVLDEKMRELNAMLKEGFKEKVKKMEAEIQQLRETSSSQQSRRGGGGCVLS